MGDYIYVIYWHRHLGVLTHHVSSLASKILIFYKTHLRIRHNMAIFTHHSKPTLTLTWRVCLKMSFPHFTSEHSQQLWQPNAVFKILSTLQTYLSNLSINHLGSTFPLITVQQLVLISLFFPDHSNLTDYLLSNVSLVLPLINIIDQLSGSTQPTTPGYLPTTDTARYQILAISISQRWVPSLWYSGSKPVEINGYVFFGVPVIAGIGWLLLP